MVVARLRMLGMLALFATLIACAPRSCSLLTEIPEEDAGDASFVRQAVPKLLGRKVRGTDETRLLVDVIRATPDGRGRAEVMNALMRDPEFSGHWQENFVDMLRVNRTGDKAQASCYGAPRLSAPDASLARFVLAQSADLPGFSGTPPAAFNMSDVLAASLAEDNVFPIYSAHLFAMQSKPLQGNETSEKNRRLDLSNTFQHTYLHRKTECLQCHHSSYSRTGPQTHWNRTFPVLGKFEKAVFANESGGDPEQLASLFRTGILLTQGSMLSDPDDLSPHSQRVPWGSLTDCGGFKAAAANNDSHGMPPHLTQALPVGSSVWNVQSLLDDGRRTLAADGLQRNKPMQCAACSTPACSGGGGLPPLPQPATANVKAIFDSHCVSCHSAASPAGGLDLQSPAWANNIIGQPSASDEMVLRVSRGDAANSLLARLLRGPVGGVPRMPMTGSLSLVDIATVDNWIASLPPAAAPAACSACTTTECTATASEVDGPPALAFLLAMNVANQMWTEVMGTPLTVAHNFPRSQAQSNVLWSLSEHTLVADNWSPRAVLKRIMLSNYFNRVPPSASLATTPYTEPLVRDPWIEADPRFPPLARTGWTPASATAPVADPSYVKADHPANHRSAMAEGVHRYSSRSLTYSMHAALGWPAPRRFPDGSYPSAALTASIGQFNKDSEPGFRETDFQGLLRWEAQHNSCARQGAATDWIDRLLDAIAAFNAANPGRPLSMADAVIVMKDWFLNDPQIRTAVLAHDGSSTEKAALDAFFGGVDIDSESTAQVARVILERQLREYCGVLVQSPQFWLAGIAPDSIGTPPRLRVCNGAPCTYDEMCTVFANHFNAPGSRYVMQCSAGGVSVAPRPTSSGLPGRWGEICPRGRCGFVRLPERVPECVKQRDPRACFPRVPPRLDVGCERIDCGGGPLPPLDFFGRPVPSMMLAWLEGGTVEKAEGVRIARGSPGDRQPFVPLKRGARLAVGDLLEIAPSAQFQAKGERGGFATPKEGLPPAFSGPASYLMVTGPSARDGLLEPPPSLRWVQSRPERNFIEAMRRKEREPVMTSPGAASREEALRPRRAYGETPKRTPVQASPDGMKR